MGIVVNKPPDFSQEHSRLTHHSQHASVLCDGAETAEESDEEDERSDGDQHPCHVLHLVPVRRELRQFDQLQDRVVDSQPDTDAQHRSPRQLKMNEFIYFFILQ